MVFISASPAKLEPRNKEIGPAKKGRPVLLVTVAVLVVPYLVNTIRTEAEL